MTQECKCPAREHPQASPAPTHNSYAAPREAFREILRTHTVNRVSLIERGERMKKRMDVGDHGADSVSFPSGEIWTQQKREGYNAAIDDFISPYK